MIVMLQQISTWRSIAGSEMGDPAPAPQQLIGLDDTIPLTMVMQFRQPGYFK